MEKQIGIGRAVYKMDMIITGIPVTADPQITQQEVEGIIAEERLLWLAKGRQIARIELSLEDEEIIVKAIEKSPICRVRRITGYLSNIENFNDAKRDELNARFKHDTRGLIND
ncbi:MAG: anaerobic ribonucleoside triphosphate reductase [Anaerosporomusa subterranea]|nr:anaerobic ribonucleoside triphosphate reductase [Anaerosporomusa subterranea]